MISPMSDFSERFKQGLREYTADKVLEGDLVRAGMGFKILVELEDIEETEVEDEIF